MGCGHVMNKKMSKIKKLSLFTILIIVVGCTTVPVYEKLYGPATPQDRILTPAEMETGNFISYSEKVQPILNNRCVVCHSCNDAPCQLNLASMEGVDRGVTKEVVYDGARLFQQDPTRIGFDANSTFGWRKKGFTPVLNERKQDMKANLDNSLLYKTIVLKKLNPQPESGRLPAEYDIGNELRIDEAFVHQQSCPDVERYTKIEQDHPQWGMPFALPGLSPDEFRTLETWLGQGARVEPAKGLPKAIKKQVIKWEKFLNGTSKKSRLMSRYVYEHLFAGHIYFDGVSDKEFFMLVRSRTAPGEEIDLIATVRPYDDPGTKNFFYRLKYYDRAIVDKTHMPYAFNAKRMVRYKKLFLGNDYVVRNLPSYEEVISANPFKTFAAIPAKNRYQFLLDEAHFFISGFIKGPVCRGSIALSVIDDHFWVLFMDPDKSYISRDSAFLARESDDLRMPSEIENNATILSVWATYKENATKFLIKKMEYYAEKYPDNKRTFNMTHIWNGDRANQNAALTIYRHYDSATVLKGLVGEVPKTGWVLDYPILERIHYLLVAGYDVYGTVGHQLSTRLYMDFLRIESELQFLAFFPAKNKIEMHKNWYRGTDKTKKALDFVKKYHAIREPDIDYKTDDVKTEFYSMVNKHLGGAQQYVDYINLCTKFKARCEAAGLNKNTAGIPNNLRQLSDIGGPITDVFPNVTFLRIKLDGSLKNDQVYTIVRNKSYLNVTSLMASENKRIKSEDTIDIVKGFVGSYPNFFLEINHSNLKYFTDQYADIDSYEEYEALVNRFGVRRTSPGFWESADWFYAKYKYDNPVYAGIFDLNRYKNR